MDYVKTQGFIIKSLDFKDTSKIIKVYTEDKGLISLIAKGAKRPKSKFRGQIELYSKVHISYQEKETRNIQVLTESEMLEFYSQIYLSELKTGVLLRIMKLLNHFLLEGKTIPRLYEVLNLTLKRVDEKKSAAVLSEYFRFLFLFLDMNGVGMDLKTCRICDSSLDETAYFNREDSMIVCEDCVKQYGGGDRMSKELNLFFQSCEKKHDEFQSVDSSLNSRIWHILENCYENHFNFKLLRL